MDFHTVQLAFQNGSIFNADLPTLRAYLHAVNQQPPHVDSRHHQIAATIQSLIDQHQNQARHHEASQQAKALHGEIQGEISKISEDLGNVKGQLNQLSQLNQLKTTLEKSHQVHSWILIIAIVTAIFALIAALDAVLRWIRGG